MSPLSPQDPFSITSREFRLLSSLSSSSREEDSTTQRTNGHRFEQLAIQPDQLDCIPPALLILASQPLVKPTFICLADLSGHAVIHNVAGNIAPVIKARKIVRDIIIDNTESPENWEELIGLKNDMKYNLVDGEECPHVICPDCEDPI